MNVGGYVSMLLRMDSCDFEEFFMHFGVFYRLFTIFL